MASRKEQKEQARAERLAKEQALAAQVQRRRRFQIFGGIVVLAVVIIGVVIAVSVGGGSSNGVGGTSKGGGAGSVSDLTGLQTGEAAQNTSKYVGNLLNGIPQNGTVLGKSSAPVTFDYYGDLQCPICRSFTMEVMPQFIKDQVRTGHAKVDYKSFCTATCNAFPMSLFNTQQVAAYAAGKQSRFWDYTELFYHEQGAEGSPYVNEAFLNDLAKQTPGLNVSTWQTDRKDPTLLSQVQADGNLALKQGIGGTPTLIVHGPKGEELVAGGNVPDYSEMVSAIKEVS